jgi:hypothetical protein
VAQKYAALKTQYVRRNWWEFFNRKFLHLGWTSITIEIISIIS